MSIGPLFVMKLKIDDAVHVVLVLYNQSGELLPSLRLHHDVSTQSVIEASMPSSIVVGIYYSMFGVLASDGDEGSSGLNCYLEKLARRWCVNAVFIGFMKIGEPYLIMGRMKYL